MRKVVIRADDLGYSEAVNYGIAKTVKEGLIKSVGFMTNMPYSEHGWNLIKDSDICLGQHTNICVGKPLTDPKFISSICDENGYFKSSKEYRNAKEDFVVLDEVILEIEAQYQRFKEITGREPDYFEGHAVSSANFFKGLEIVAQRHGLDYLGFALDGPVTFRNTKLRVSMESMGEDYNPTEVIKRFSLNDYEDDECGMFVCHPGWLDEYILNNSSLTINRTKEVTMLCDPEVKSWLENHDVNLVTYSDLD